MPDRLYPIDLLTAPFQELQKIQADQVYKEDKRLHTYLRLLLNRPTLPQDDQLLEVEINIAAKKVANTNTPVSRITALGARPTPAIYNSVLLANLFRTGLNGDFYDAMIKILEKTNDTSLNIIDTYLVYESLSFHIQDTKAGKTRLYIANLNKICTLFGLPAGLLKNAYTQDVDLSYENFSKFIADKRLEKAQMHEVQAHIENAFDKLNSGDGDNIDSSDEKQTSSNTLFANAVSSAVNNWIARHYIATWRITNYTRDKIGHQVSKEHLSLLQVVLPESEKMHITTDGKHLKKVAIGYYKSHNKISHEKEYAIAKGFFEYALNCHASAGSDEMFKTITQELRNTGINRKIQHYSYTDQSLFNATDKQLIELPILSHDGSKEGVTKFYRDRSEARGTAIAANKAQGKVVVARILYDARKQLANFLINTPLIENLDALISHIHSFVSKYFKLSLGLDTLFDDKDVMDALFTYHIIPRLNKPGADFGDQTLNLLQLRYPVMGEERSQTVKKISALHPRFFTELPYTVINNGPYRSMITLLSKPRTHANKSDLRTTPLRLVFLLFAIARYNIDEANSKHYDSDCNTKLEPLLSDAAASAEVKNYLKLFQVEFIKYVADYGKAKKINEKTPKALLKLLCELFDLDKAHDFYQMLGAEPQPEQAEELIITNSSLEDAPKKESTQPKATFNDELEKLDENDSVLDEMHRKSTAVTHTVRFTQGELVNDRNWFGRENEITFGNIKTHGNVAGIGGSRLRPGFTGNHDL